MRIYKKFIHGGIPEYLAYYYWWAYLWEKSIWFFDHQVIINAILFGQYDRLLQKTLALVDAAPGRKILQLTCVYGKLSPSLLHHTNNEIHLCDVAVGQLNLAKSKTLDVADRCFLARMNAEDLAYADDAFDQVIVFFLLHELPARARQHVYAEIARVLKPGGSILLTEYAETPYTHYLYRFPPSRFLFGYLEPFLPSFWQEDVAANLRDALAKKAKKLLAAPHVEKCFNSFYRVMRFEVGCS